MTGIDWFTAMWLEREWDSARHGDALGAALVSSSASTAVITDLCFLTSGPRAICEGTETQLHTVILSDPKESLNLLGTSTRANTGRGFITGLANIKQGWRIYVT